MKISRQIYKRLDYECALCNQLIPDNTQYIRIRFSKLKLKDQIICYDCGEKIAEFFGVNEDSND